MRIGYSKIDRFIWLAPIMMCIFLLFMPFIYNLRFDGPCTIIFYYTSILCLLLFFIWRMIESYNYILVFLEGIIQIKSFRKPLFFSWDEIRYVRGGFWTRGLHLANEDGTKKLHLSPDYLHFNIFLELLRVFCPDLWQTNLPMTFYKSPYLILFFLGTGISLSVFGGYEILIHKNPQGFLLLFFSLGGYLFPSILPMRLTIQGNALVLKYLFRTKTIHNSEISHIRTEPQPVLPLMNFSILEIKLRNKKVIDLSWFNIGASMLYMFLMNWWGKASIRQLHKGYLLLDKPVKIPSIKKSEFKQLTSGE